jgi:hypothetical protein
LAEVSSEDAHVNEPDDEPDDEPDNEPDDVSDDDADAVKEMDETINSAVEQKCG